MRTLTRWDEDGDDHQIPVTKELVEGLRDAALEFTEVVNLYIRMRREVDPDFKDVPYFNLEGDEDVAFDVQGDTVTVQWKEYGRCGDADYYNRSFPFSDLWDPDWEARVKTEKEKKARKEAEKKAAAERARNEAQEKRDRELLRALQAKYGETTP